MSQKLILFLAALLALAAARASAQGAYPKAQDSYINDFAHLIAPQEAGEIRGRLERLRREGGIEAVVVTIGSIHDYPTGDGSIESYATHLFNAWGVGDKNKHNGALLLVAVRDRKVRIEVGAGYGRTRDEAMKRIIDEKILPHFRGQQFSTGIAAGALAMADTLVALGLPAERPAGMPPAPAPVAVAPPQPPAPPRAIPPMAVPYRPQPMPYEFHYQHRSGFSITFLFVPLLLALGGVLAVPLCLRNRKRICSHCQTEMQRLDDFADDMFLDSGQKIEEQLNSVDYEIWKCPTCGMQTMERNRRWFSGYGDCPACGYRTLRDECETISHPTTMSTGQKRVTHDCRNCGHHGEEIVILPMLSRSDHSITHSSGSSFGGGGSSFGGGGGGGGSFGGGSSSGGGASGSW